MRISDWSSDVCSSDLMNVGEKADDEALAKQYAALCDVFVMDAFGTAHRAQASTHGVIRFAKAAAGGPLLMGELDALAKALDEPARPLLAIVAGSKVSTKLELLSSLVGKVDQLIVGRSEEHTSELQSLMRNSYAVFCLKNKNKKTL